MIGVADAPAAWQKSVAYAEAPLAAADGFDFNEDRDGLWIEGTAQAALTYRALGRTADAERLLGTIARQVSPSGLLFATDVPRLTTGIRIGPANTQADFFDFRRPHLGATAWGVLAATAWNPSPGASRSNPDDVRSPQDVSVILVTDLGILIGLLVMAGLPDRAGSAACTPFRRNPRGLHPKVRGEVHPCDRTPDERQGSSAGVLRHAGGALG